MAVTHAGDGTNAHPTHALLEAYTIRQHRPGLENFNVALVGGVQHSRVARSTIAALQTLGNLKIHSAAQPGICHSMPTNSA